ncbi:phytoene/squalene synthetase [Rhodobacter sp. JA431]|uniref:squalene/phytoene synthase family protein n=1 Tax=Rhodobacter sp. JA431 TaxID=570013 RepID=UPI000BCF4F51|nr:squalene/phytoene synthase family protein [Rhodobacter sp. JA431]SOB98332.1 phytoene/squalene synthetase [Rhodobacter sp. JA431]
MSDAIALCAQRLETGDPDRFAAVMALPGPMRPAGFALYALNLELAHAPWASPEPMVAEIRLQWWIEALEAQGKEGREIPHDIGPALANIAPQAIELMMEAGEARRADCWSDPFEDAARLWDYLDATAGAPMAALGLCLGAEAEVSLRAYGAAAGLANWLVAQPELTARGRLGLSGATPQNLAALAKEGLARLSAAEAALKAADQPARFAALAGWQARAILQKAARTPEAITKGTLRGSDFSRRFTLLKARLAA